jgi:hypothetical protein
MLYTVFGSLFNYEIFRPAPRGTFLPLYDEEDYAIDFYEYDNNVQYYGTEEMV